MRIKNFLKGVAAARWYRRILPVSDRGAIRGTGRQGGLPCLQVPNPKPVRDDRRMRQNRHRGFAGMGNVENNRQVAAGLFHHAETEHIDNEVVVAEAAAAFA